MSAGGAGRALLVVPCFREAARLDRQAFLDFAASPEGHRLLLVDDGSDDGTAEVLRDLASRAPERLEALVLPRNRGKAEAVRQGILAARNQAADYLGFWDADLATPLSTIPLLCGYLDRRPEVDIVLGSRVMLLGRTIDRSATRHAAGRVFATAASLTLGLPVYDTQCGAKMFRSGPLVGELFGEPFLSNWSFDVEILARYLEARGRAGALRGVHEFPLPEWRDVPGSKVRPWDFLTALGELWRIHRRYRLRRG